MYEGLIYRWMDEWINWLIWLGFKFYIIVTINILYKYKILLSLCLAEDNVVIERSFLDENEEEGKKPLSVTLKIWS